MRKLYFKSCIICGFVVFLQLSLSRVISHNTKKISWRAPSCNRFGQHGSWENFCPLHLQQKSPFWWPVCRSRGKLHGFYNLNFMICGWKWDNIIYILKVSLTLFSSKKLYLLCLCCLSMKPWDNTHISKNECWL